MRERERKFYEKYPYFTGGGHGDCCGGHLPTGDIFDYQTGLGGTHVEYLTIFTPKYLNF